VEAAAVRQGWTFAQKAVVVLASLQLLWALAGFVAEPSFHFGAGAPTASAPPAPPARRAGKAARE